MIAYSGCKKDRRSAWVTFNKHTEKEIRENGIKKIVNFIEGVNRKVVFIITL